MQVNSVNNYQNFGGASKIMQTAARHIKNNADHYGLNAINLAVGAVMGNISSVENAIGSKVILDALEAGYAVLRNRRTPNGYANFNRPLTNTVIWIGKGTWKLLEKVFGKSV